jgi:hypothetical protein
MYLDGLHNPTTCYNATAIRLFLRNWIGHAMMTDNYKLHHQAVTADVIEFTTFIQTIRNNYLP